MCCAQHRSGTRKSDSNNDEEQEEEEEEVEAEDDKGKEEGKTRFRSLIALLGHVDGQSMPGSLDSPSVHAAIACSSCTGKGEFPFPATSTCPVAYRSGQPSDSGQFKIVGGKTGHFKTFVIKFK